MTEAHVPADPADRAVPDDEPPTGAAGAARSRRRLPRPLRRVLLGTAILCGVAVLVVGGSYTWMRASAGSHEFSVADAPAADVALVLGAGLRADGSPSEYLQYRLDDAVALYRAGRVKVLLVSGDNRTSDHDEPTAMRDYLVTQGTPADRIVRDFAGQDTYDSCVRAKEIFGVTRLLVVTQQFHLHRAVFLCRQVGIDADGAADPHPLVSNSPELREIPASVKAAWDAIWQPGPRHSGPVEDGVTRALATG
ncbi:MAG: YdcF family protein [Williamsia herbipolensis]|nr:YdcF family protein [Williamsia herbipolensis]